MIRSAISRFHRTSTHPVLLSLFVAVFALSDPARSAMMLGIWDTASVWERLRSRLLARRA